MQNIGLEQQQQIRGGDGTLLWSGSYVIGIPYHAKAGASAIAMGEAVRWDDTNGVLPRQETTAAGGTPSTDLPMSRVIQVQKIAGATDLIFLGVSTEPIGAAGTGLIAGIGSLLTVLSTTVALALGTTVGGSATTLAVGAATAGLVQANTTATQILGTVFKINTAGGTGSTSWAGIFVNPR